MAKDKSVFVCSSCGYESPKWMGKCPACNQWNTFYEEKLTKGASSKYEKKKEVVPMVLNNLEGKEISRNSTGFSELDRVLGGGLVNGSLVLQYGEHEMDLSKPFERITMVDAVKKYAGVDWNEIKDLDAARAIAKEKNVEFEEHHKKGDILNLFFEEFVEEHLIQPTFVMDHPIEISPLTKKKPENPEYVERFEMFMNGWEMCNAYSELNDPIDQRARFEAQEELFAAGDEEANHTDEDFLNALCVGMPPTGGIGYGIDRMVMLMTNSPAIRDVLLFPTMKTLQ